MSDGLGDKLEKVLASIGVKTVAEGVARILDTDCGCAERKEKLNALGKRLRIGSEGAVEVVDQDEPPDQDDSSMEARRARNAALKAAWEKEHGRPYGRQSPG